MKADEPQPPIVKYGMTIEHQHRIVERHFAVLDSEHAISAANFFRALRLGAQARAVLTRGKVHALPEPVAVVSEPAPERALPVILPPVRPQKLLGLRAQLGLE